MLELKNISKTFFPGTVHEKTALDNLSLTLHEGDFVTVIGGNGAGKSTMLNAIAGTFSVDSGSILIDGKDVTRLPEFKRAALLGRVFQDPMMGTAPTMQIQENLALAARRGKHRGLKWGITPQEEQEYYQKLKDLDLGLEDRMKAKVGLLSGRIIYHRGPIRQCHFARNGADLAINTDKALPRAGIYFNSTTVTPDSPSP